MPPASGISKAVREDVPERSEAPQSIIYWLREVDSLRVQPVGAHSVAGRCCRRLQTEGGDLLGHERQHPLDPRPVRTGRRERA
jgi:hypothetical protein